MLFEHVSALLIKIKKNTFTIKFNRLDHIKAGVLRVPQLIVVCEGKIIHKYINKRLTKLSISPATDTPY